MRIKEEKPEKFRVAETMRRRKAVHSQRRRDRLSILGIEKHLTSNAALLGSHFDKYQRLNYGFNSLNGDVQKI